MKPNSKFETLDSLRGISAMTVAIFHASWMSAASQIDFFRNGDNMIGFFFMLSGFLICHVYRSNINHSVDLARFMWMRLGRLYPLHIVMLFLFLGLECLKLFSEWYLGLVDTSQGAEGAFSLNNGVAFLKHILLIHPFSADPTTFNSPSWSVGVIFYTTLLFGLLALLRSNVLRCLAFAGLTLIAFFILYYMLDYVNLIPGVWVMARCLYGFFLGVLIYELLFHYQLFSINKNSGIIAVLLQASLLLFIYAFVSFYNGTASTILFPLIGGLTLVAFVIFPKTSIARGLCVKPLAWLGKISYSVYLTHALVLWVFKATLMFVFKVPYEVTNSGTMLNINGWPSILVLVFYIITVLMVSQLAYQWIEEPCRKKAKAWADKRLTRKPAQPILST